MFFKEGNFRQEMMMGGQKQITIFRKDKNLVWVLMPAQNDVYGNASRQPAKYDAGRSRSNR